MAFGTCSTVWGSTFLAIAIGNDHVPPVWAATLRLVLASAILFTVMAVRRQPLPAGEALRSAVGFGFFQFGINFPLLYLGEKEVPSGLTAVIFATIPLSQSLLTRIAGLERLTPAKILGALIALLGVALIFLAQMTTRVRPQFMLFVLMASWAGCLGTVILKRGPRQSPIASNAVGALVGAVSCFLWSLLLHEPLSLPTAAALVPILYLAVAGSVVAFVLMAWLVNHWEVSRVSYIAVVIPVVALALGAAVRHEQVSPTSLAGAAVVLGGVVIGLGLWRSRARSAPRWWLVR